MNDNKIKCQWEKDGFCTHPYGEGLPCNAEVPCGSGFGVVTVHSHGGVSKYKLDEDGIDRIFQFLEIYGESFDSIKIQQLLKSEAVIS